LKTAIFMRQERSTTGAGAQICELTAQLAFLFRLAKPELRCRGEEEGFLHQQRRAMGDFGWEPPGE
jgi:hypothetical protein